jgi:hypothetical protein
MKIQTAESIIGKCDKQYNEKLMEREAIRKYKILDDHCLSLPTSPKQIEKQAIKAYYEGLNRL